MKKLIVLLLFFCSCDPPKQNTTKDPFYPQDFSAPDAWLALEWNRTLRIMASGFLIDREKGVLMTAKHFTDEFESSGSDTCKVFMDGRVYDAFLIRVPPLKDAGLLKLKDFDPQYLPEPYPISQREVAVGDVLHVRGFHIHPNNLIEENSKEGHADYIVPIIEKYYKNFGRLIELQDREVVYHNISVSVEVLDTPVKLGEEGDMFARERDETNLYIQTKTERDHKLSFGGLSGGVAVNDQNEIVGVITAEQRGFEYIPFGGPFFLGKIKYETVFITPISDLQGLLDYVKQAR